MRRYGLTRMLVFTLSGCIPLLVDTVRNNTLAKGYGVEFFQRRPLVGRLFFCVHTNNLSVFIRSGKPSSLLELECVTRHRVMTLFVCYARVRYLSLCAGAV